jgi:phage shock protein A
VSETSWSPPTGPPNGAPVRSADARHEIEDAIDQARRHDRELRAEIIAASTARTRAADRLAAASAEVGEARSLAERALRRANDAARAGQRADAAKLTGAARVFALRMRDAHQQVAWLEQQVAAATQRTQQVHTALSENVGRLKAVAAARLPVLSGRKAARAQQAVDETVAAISAPTSDLLVRGAEAARAALDEQAAAGGAVVPVAEDDLENEVDLDGADAILDELRDELGLPAPTAGAATGDAGAPAGSGAESEDAAADEAAGGDPAGRGAAAADARGGGPAGADASGGSGDDRRVPASRR